MVRRLESHLRTRPQPLPRALPAPQAALGSSDFPAVQLPGFNHKPLMWMKWHSPPGTSAAICFGCVQSQAQWWGPDFPPWSDSEHRRWNERFWSSAEALLTFRYAVPGYLSLSFLKVRNGSQPMGSTIGKVFSYRPLFCTYLKIDAFIYSVICWLIYLANMYWPPTK